MMKTKHALRFAVPLLLQSFWAAEAWSRQNCQVNVNLACVRPANAGQIVLTPLTWTPKSQSARTSLSNSLDVNGSPASCAAFAQLLKTECAIELPVTAVFGAGPGMPRVINLVTGFYTEKACEPDLSPAFKSYFSSVGVAGAPAPAVCIPPTITFPTASLVAYRGITIAPLVPTNTGGIFTYCSVTPPLPKGLTLSTSTCSIIGVPAVVTPQTTYTVRGTTSTGVGEAKVDISVIDINAILPVIFRVLDDS